MRTTILATGLALALAAPALSGCGDSGVVAEAQASEIAWRHGDVEDALAEAKETGKPVLLYWGAVWCPPCAQMKATLFKDPAFIAKTEQFIPVYLDGDTEGAQKWGEEFGASGYPTVIVLSPDGEEITRLSSSTMASELSDLLTLAAGRTRSIDALIADAREDTSKLSEEDWKVLASFDWGNDRKRFSEQAEETALLATLAQAAPNPAIKRQFGLQVLLREAGEDDDGNVKLTAAQGQQVKTMLGAILDDPTEREANISLLAYQAATLVSGMPAGADRDAMADKLAATLQAMNDDAEITLLDRTFALRSEVDLAKNTGGISDALKDKVRTWVAKVDKEASDELVRKSVISYAAGALDKIGDREGAKKLLLAETEKSASGYYYMSILSDYAAEDGDSEAAIEWARKAYEASEGGATRVQWAANYSATVMKQAPKDEDAVRESANAVLNELGKSPDSYYQRTRSIMDGWSKMLVSWSEKNDGGDVLDDLKATFAEVCAKQGKDAQACGTLGRAA